MSTYIPIASQTLASATSTVTFSGIANTSNFYSLLNAKTFSVKSTTSTTITISLTNANIAQETTGLGVVTNKRVHSSGSIDEILSGS